jgi:GxxExxY protein
MELTKTKLNQLTYEIIGAAIEVHSQLGPGLLESIYHECMKIELKTRAIPYETEMIIPVYYDDRKLETTLRCDLFIANSIVVELKSVKQFEPIFDAQLITYMKLLNAPKGLLINFNCTSIFKEGQKTLVNELFRKLPE